MWFIGNLYNLDVSFDDFVGLVMVGLFEFDVVIDWLVGC